MDDKGRCLHQLSQEVKRLTLVEVQKYFLSGEVDKGADLLSRWEQYLQLTKNEPSTPQTHETLSSTIEIFCKRLEALQNVLNSLPRQKCVEVLHEKLTTLEERFAAAKVGVKGGTFEWVDSVLVKCLREGSWLMVDNVNLCSPAVLDRLNGLLEPGGELVIGERGVGVDGHLVTVKPHPHFRLFLLMDPSFGEISRAMRNRGVELCLLDSDEAHTSLMDLQAILSHIGVSRFAQQKALINVHDEMKKLAIGFESITNNHLFQAAALTVQQMARGVAFSTSLRSACVDVYIQGRQLSIDQKDRCSQLLYEILREQETLINSRNPDIRDALDTKVATLGTLVLQENSAFALIQQKCALLSTVLRLLGESKNCSLKDIFEEAIKDEDAPLLQKTIADIVPHILLTIISSMSESDVHLRRDIILSMIASCKKAEDRNKLSELEKYLTSTLQQAIKTRNLNALENVQRKDLCWDLRRISPWIVDSKNCDYENKTLALFFFFLNYLQLNVKLGEIKTTVVKNMSALDFSTAYNKGKVTLASVTSPVVLELSMFLEGIEDQIHSVLESSGGLNEEQCCQLLSGVQWALRLLRVGQRKLFVGRSREMEVSEDVTVMLSLHVRWVKKWLFPSLTRLLTRHTKRQESGQLPPQLSEMCSSAFLADPMRSLSKRVRLTLGQPLPLSDSLKAQLSHTITRLESMVDLSYPDQLKELIQKKVQFLQSSEGRHTRAVLSEGNETVCTSDNLIGVIHQLEKIETKLTSANMVNFIPTTEEKDLLVRQHKSSWNWEVALWPVRGVVCLRLMSAVKNSPSEQLVECLASWARDLPLVPSRLLALLTEIKTGDNKMCATTELMIQLTQSPVITNPRAWLQWGSLWERDDQSTDEEARYFSSNSEVYPLQSPLMAVFTTSLIHNAADHHLATSSLRNHLQHSRLLAALQETLWTTASSLATSLLNYSKNEAESMEKSYERFLNAVKMTAETKLTNRELSPIEKHIFTLLSELMRSKTLDDNIKHKGFSREIEDLIKDLATHVQTLEISRDKLRQEKKESVKWVLIGEAWVHVGLLKLRLFAHQDHVDPVEKNQLKVQYSQEEREGLERSLAAEKAQGLILGSYLFPLAEAFVKRVMDLQAREEHLKKFVAVRPQPNTYTALYNEMQQLMAVMVWPGERVVAMVASLQACVTSGKDIHEAVSRAQSLLTSLHMSADSLNKKYGIWYPDFVAPITSAISEVSHGLALMISGLRNLSVNQQVVVEPVLKALVRFPLPDRSAALQLVDVCTSACTLGLIQAASRSQPEEGGNSSGDIFRLAKCSLQELRNLVSVRGVVGEDWAAVCQILDHLVMAWQKQEQDRAQRELEEGNFFINKARKVENMTEEEEDALEMRKLFPSYRDKDFADLEPPSLEQKKVLPNIDVTSTDLQFKLTQENILEIHKVHSEILGKNTKAHWLPQSDFELLDFVSPFTERFTIFSVLLDSLYLGCDSTLDSEVAPALCLGVHLASASGTKETQSRKKHYDFYHDPSINEVKLCVPVLRSLTGRVLNLLAEWPDHPTLNQIMLVINRILEFPVESPVSRFLVGLELLSTRLREWEENAHAGVTLGPHAAALTRLILDWRKLELTQWRGCLESARIRLYEGMVSKWWFHLYSLVRETEEDTSQLAAVLEKFMESSNMAEFQTRLDLLFTFHCHCINNQQKIQSHVLWNVHQYYTQFSGIIARRIKELSLPVEKKLRDFVKIARWNDINYWAVKETVDKTHRTLFKYIREYEGILKQPARTAMTKLDPIRGQDTAPSVTPILYVAPSTLVQNLPEVVDSGPAGSLMHRQRSLFNKARKLSRESVANCPLPGYIRALHLVLDELQEISQLMSTEDVDRSVSKEKQKSAARSVLHRKHKTLTDLFHTLAGLGLSYRAGLVVVGAEAGEFQFATHAPLSLAAGLAQMDNRAADKELLAVWGGCDESFLHSVAHLAQLKTVLASPHKDLGPAIIDRCKGFTNHLMSLCHEQKRSVTESVTCLYVLRCLVQHLDSLQPTTHTSSAELGSLKSDLVSVLEDVVYCLSQFDVLLDTCPEKPDIIDLTDSSSQTPPVILECAEVVMNKGDENWSKTKAKISSTMRSAKKSKMHIEEKGKYVLFLDSFQRTNGMKIFESSMTYEHFETVKEGYEKLSAIKDDINDITDVFRMRAEGDVNPMVYSLNQLQQKIKQCLGTFLLFQSGYENQEHGGEREFKPVDTKVSSLVETLLNKVLFAVQEFYKKNTQKVAEIPESSDNQKLGSETDPELHDSHLKEKILTELQSNIEILKLSEITRDLQILLFGCKENLSKTANVEHIQQCVPFLYQYSLVVQFLVTQQVSALHTSSQLCSSLLSLFVDLANKGFRVPEELLEQEEGEGSTAGGLGLGEGEGEKDVSDQIESQDQLEDAKKPGEHEQDEEKDCKEEEKGIEMSDDFGGKLQDIEKKDDEDGSGEESGEEEEPDKEMGDTEKGAETLDQQIWGGSDSEEEDDDTGEREEEEGDRGEQISEKEMGAKEDDKTPQGEEDEKQGNEEKNDKKKEINEMEDPEVDDDQIDPYHGKNPPQPEPEPLDLPDDLQLDDGEGPDKDDEAQEDNPFDIDAMKEPKLPEEKEVPEECGDEQLDTNKDKEENPETDSSDEEGGEGDGKNQEPEEMDVDEPEQNQEEDKSAEDGGAKDENKSGEEAKIEEEKKEEENNAKPSEDLPASEPVPSSQQDSGSKDQVQQPENSDQSKELSPDDSAAEGPDQQGVGAAHNQQQDAPRGSKGESQQAVQSQNRDLREEKRERPGESEEQRALGDVQEPQKKKLKTINMEKENESTQEQKNEEGIKEDQSAEMYQHIKEVKESTYDAQTLDAATQEQVAEQKLPNKEEEQAEELKDDTDMALDQEDPKTENENITKVNSEKLKEASEEKKEGLQQPSKEGERVEGDGDKQMEVEGEVVETATVARGPESWFHTRLDVDDDEAAMFMTQADLDSVRKDLQLQLSSWNQPPGTEEAGRAWERLSCVTADLSRDLSEQLRLVLEPTHASRLRGDYRTGRRINMRKVIPYIASQFRKDKIWLRRTKPAKREYQIVLAIDDSSSMADNHSKELAFESLAVVSKALSLLEAGQLSVLSFGEKPKILHQLGDPFTEHSGARLLQQFSFEQQKTQVAALVNFACSLFEQVPVRRGVTDVAQLLVIVSDGRGVLNDGEELVKQAVRRAKHMGVFMVFVIVDNPQSKDSILDIRLPKFNGGKLLGIVPYMDSFPFPFYLILRDINCLPSVLSDALRQWFELVTSTS